MKLLIATGIYPPEIGGPAGYVKGIATELANQGHEIAVVTYGDEKTENATAYRVIVARRAPNILRRYFEYFWQTFKLAREADLVYAQGPVSEGLPATLASIFARKPLVLKVVGDYAWEQYQQLSASSFELLDEFVARRHEGKVWLMEAIERWVAKRAKTIIVPSKYLKTIVTQWRISPDKIKVIYNSIASLPRFESEEHRAIKASDKQRRIILTAVRAVPWKGGDFLCDVIKDLPEEYILAVAGDGPELENWKKHAEEIGVSDRVMWLGRLSRAELTEWYHRAHLFVLATGYEGFPHVVVEAVSTGLPCIVSDKGGNPEIAEFFPNLVRVAPYQDKQAWVEAINRTLYPVPRTPYKDGLPEILGFNKMMAETLTVLLSRVPHRAFFVDTSVSARHPEPANHHPELSAHHLKFPVCHPEPANCHPELVSGSLHQDTYKTKLIMISLDRKLFEPGQVRYRIVGQLKDFEATIIVFAKQKFDEQIAPNVRIISTNSWNKFFYVWDAIRIAWKLRNTGIKVVITQDPVETGLAGVVSARLCNSALAVQDHGYHFHGKYYYQESILNHFRYWFAKWLVGRADAIRVVSQRTESALVNLGIQRAKIIRFPLTLNNECSSYDVGRGTIGMSDERPLDSARGRLGTACPVDTGWDERRMSYFLLVCRFVPIKRIDLAIHAFSIFAKKNSDVKLKIVGQGPLQEQIQKWIADFEMQDRIEIIPWTENLSDLYHGATATLITSDGEGFGMTAVESLMCGTPVIMTDVGCAREVVKHGENGYIVRIGDVHGLASAMEVMLQNRLSVSQPKLASENVFGEFVKKAVSNDENNRSNIID